MNKKTIYRVLFFAATILVPMIFSWWLFVPLLLLYVYLVDKPFEIILSGFILGSVYYFGESFFQKYLLVEVAFAFVVLALFLNTRLYWRKIM